MPKFFDKDFPSDPVSLSKDSRFSPTIRPIPFVEQSPFWGTHLQTIRMVFRKDHPDVSAMNCTNVTIPMNDGTGDQLTGVIHTPENPRYPGLIVVAGHGYGGNADSPYMVWLTKFFFEQGVAVIRLNWRGAGNSRALCQKDYHGGGGDDLLRVCNWLLNAKSDQLPVHFTQAYLCGTSLSGSIVANALAKIDNSDIAPAKNFSGVLGGISICPGFDVEQCIRRIQAPRNWPYLRYLLGKIKPVYENHPKMPHEIKARITKAKTISEIDDVWLAPQTGYSTALEFYKHIGSIKWVSEVKRSLRVIATMNDPWINPAGFFNCDWSNPLLQPRMFAKGGHCGLWEKGFCYQRHFREARDHLWSLMEHH